MSETKMSTTDAAVERTAHDDERVHYELAFHILPTVVEGEVAPIVAALREAIMEVGGEVVLEEHPQRFDLAYEIMKYVEGKYRRFHSAYFGWIRFDASADAIASITEAVDEHPSILRHLLIRLTHSEAESPFYFHEALNENSKVNTVDEEATAPDVLNEEGGEEVVDDATTFTSSESDNADDVKI